jgi:hypothetical protein
MIMRSIIFRLGFVLIGFLIGALGGGVIVLVCYSAKMNFNSTQNFIAFWSFPVFGFITGVVKALTFRGPR